MGGDSMDHLHDRLAQEVAERDATRQVLSRLRGAVEFSQQRLRGVLERPAGMTAREETACAKRARDLVAEMESQVKSIAGEAGMQAAVGALLPSRPTGSHEALRKSVLERQRQCDLINQEMLTQAEANEGLVDMLGTVKDGNKRLLEQIRSQTTEIATLTSQRLGDEDRIEQMRRRHESDRDAASREAQLRLVSLRDAADERRTQAHAQLTEKAARIQGRAEVLQQDAARLRGGLSDVRRDAEAMMDAVQAQLQSWGREASSKLLPVLGDRLQRHRAWKAGVDVSVGELRSQLEEGAARRREERLASSQRHASLSTDREDMQATMAREVSQLSLQLQLQERQQREARTAWAEERASLERQVDEHVKQQGSLQVALGQLQRDLVELETKVLAGSREVAGVEKLLPDLKCQARESDNAVAAAVSSNEHLRRQMEEQRERFAATSEAELNDCRDGYEQKLAAWRLTGEAEASMAGRQLDALLVSLRALDAQAAALVAPSQDAAKEAAMLEVEVSSWRSRHDDANAHREALEREFNESKQGFQAERLKLQARIDHMGAQSTELSEEIRKIAGELEELRRSAMARQTEAQTRRGAAEGMLGEARGDLADAEARLGEAKAETERVLGAATTVRDRELEVQAALARNLEAQGRAAEEERRRLELTLEAEQRAYRQAKEEVDRDREHMLGNLQRMQDESRLKLEGADRERNRIEEVCRSDIAQGGRLVAQHRRRVEALEHDCGKLRALLADSQANLAAVRQDQSFEQLCAPGRHALLDLPPHSARLHSSPSPVRSRASLTAR